MKKFLILIFCLVSIISFSNYYSIDEIKKDGYKLYSRQNDNYALFTKNGELYCYIYIDSKYSFRKVEEQEFVREISNKYKKNINFFTVDETKNNIYVYIMGNSIDVFRKIENIIEKKYNDKKEKIVYVTNIFDGDTSDPKIYYNDAFDILLNFLNDRYEINKSYLRLSKDDYYKLYEAFSRQEGNEQGIIRVLFHEFEVVVPYEINSDSMEFLEFKKDKIRIYDGLRDEYINGGDYYEENNY